MQMEKGIKFYLPVSRDGPRNSPSPIPRGICEILLPETPGKIFRGISGNFPRSTGILAVFKKIFEKFKIQNCIYFYF